MTPVRATGESKTAFSREPKYEVDQHYSPHLVAQKPNIIQPYKCWPTHFFNANLKTTLTSSVLYAAGLQAGGNSFPELKEQTISTKRTAFWALSENDPTRHNQRNAKDCIF